MNRYTSIGDTRYYYNSNGSLTSKTGKTTCRDDTDYKYDYENRFISVKCFCSGWTVNYKYDSLGRRIEVNDNGRITKYIYDGARVIAETDSAGNVIAEYVYGVGLGEILYMIKGNNFYYYHYDGLGNVRAITGSSRNIIESYTYDVLWHNQQYITSVESKSPEPSLAIPTTVKKNLT